MMRSRRSVVGSLLVVTTLLAGGVAFAATVPVVEVVRSGNDALEVMVSTEEVGVRAVKTSEGDFSRLGWDGDTSLAGAIGAPEIPVVRRLVAVPAGTTASVRWDASDPVTVQLDPAAARVYPVQPPVPKLPGAAANAPFALDPAGYTTASFEGDLAAAGALPPARGQVLAVLEARPVVYDPAAGTVTVWRTLRVTVSFDGDGRSVRPLPAAAGLSDLLLNPEVVSWTEARAGGNYLILVAQSLESTIAPFAAAKTAQGYSVTTSVVTPGTSNTAVKQVISTAWAGPTPPDYVLLVGDTDTIPHWTGGGAGSPATDLPYACMDAGDDWMPDLPVGRFPARTTAQLQAMIDKTLYVENGLLADPAYLKRAVFMAGVDNNHITEGTHDWVIATHMDQYGFTSEKLYEVTYSADTQDVRDSFNDGRFYGIFSGHGGTYSWADGPPFSQTDVTNLANQNLYSAVWSFACITGTYTVDECFMETWVRAPGKGAAVAIGSSVNSYWTEDDVLEKRLFDAIFDNSDDVRTEVGPVWDETRARYVAQMGGDSTTRRYFEMYNIMGDPSLRLVGACSEAGTVALDRSAYSCQSQELTVTVNDCGLNLDDTTIDTTTVLVTSTSEPAGESLYLTETDAASAEFTGTLALDPVNAPGILHVVAGDLIEAIYVDADDGQGGLNVVVTAEATVDCSPPTIEAVRTDAVGARDATVAYDSNEIVSSLVRYGASCAGLTQSAGGSPSTTPLVELTGLVPSTTYFYDVTATDLAGNSASDDNAGACYSFSTLVVPDFFTELFDSGNDLQGSLLKLVPDGSGDVYSLCVEPLVDLPVDPAGGTALSLSDDDSEQISLPPGLTVWYYGTDYTSIHVGSNGYVTFDGGDTDYTESLDDHFDQVRVSALFDDLNPSSGGTVSWKTAFGDTAVAVTWDGVPEYSSSNSNTFQVVLFKNGALWMAYDEVAADDGLAGLSEGAGLDLDFGPSDLTGYGPCTAPPLFGDGFESGDCTQWSDEVPGT